jgi:hypothetical protein
MCPTGKSVDRVGDLPVQPYLQKYFCFSEMQIRLSDLPSCPTEGRFAIVTDARRDAVDVGGAKDEGAGLRTAKTCGPDAPTLASSS